MRKTEIIKDGYKYKWSVEGLNEFPCVKDIESNGRTELTDYAAVMFEQRYGCVANVEKVRVMTHNQYHDFMTDNANRLYADNNYTMDDYKRDSASVDILDFDLSRFNLSWSESGVSVINELFTYESVNKNGNMYLIGHVANDDIISLLASKLDLQLVCNKGFNGFYKNDNDKCVLEFCEGDVSLIVCELEDAYKTEIDSYNKFYELEESSLDNVLEDAKTRSFSYDDNKEALNIEIDMN